MKKKHDIFLLFLSYIHTYTNLTVLIKGEIKKKCEKKWHARKQRHKKPTVKKNIIFYFTAHYWLTSLFVVFKRLTVSLSVSVVISLHFDSSNVYPFRPI